MTNSPDSPEDEAPKLIDRRSSSREGQTHDPILDQPTDYSRNRNRLANVRWKRGEDPRDDLATGSIGAHVLTPEEAAASPGYVDYDIEMLEHPVAENVDPFAGVHGTDAGFKCWTCKRHNYLIVDERTSAQVGAAQDDVAWARKMNRPVDPAKVPDVLMLLCPGCKSVMQMRKEIVMELGGIVRP